MNSSVMLYDGHTSIDRPVQNFIQEHENTGCYLENLRERESVCEGNQCRRQACMMIKIIKNETMEYSMDNKLKKNKSFVNHPN